MSTDLLAETDRLKAIFRHACWMDVEGCFKAAGACGDCRCDCTVANSGSQPVDLLPTSVRPRHEPQRERCEIVGQLDDTLFDADIPAGQLRGIHKRIVLPNLPRISGRFAWQMRVVKVRGSDASSTPYDDIIAKYGL